MIPTLLDIILGNWHHEIRRRSVYHNESRAVILQREDLMVTVNEFRALDIRIGTIVSTEPIPGTNHLLRVRVDLGTESREVVAGIAGTYGPQDLVGLQVVLIANMVPATIRGVKSEGMLLGVGCDGDAGISLLTVNRPVTNGARVQ